MSPRVNRRSAVKPGLFLFPVLLANLLPYSQQARVIVAKSLMEVLMPRRADPQNVQQLRQVIEKHPGRKPGFLARLLRWSREKVSRGLVALNDHGVLLYEDDEGRLWLCPKEDE
jgi:hypothetical protein